MSSVTDKDETGYAEKYDGQTHCRDGGDTVDITYEGLIINGVLSDWFLLVVKIS